jgi:hypothetical protein
MDHQVLRLRAAIRRYQHGRAPRAVRYPAAVRRTATALARRRRADGATLKAIAHDVGVAPWTLALWLRTPPSATIRAVDIVPEVPATRPPVRLSPVLITRHGLRVEGLDRDALVAVLRALG